MVETSKVEAYITTTFTKITDEQNCPLNISTAGPTLFHIITGHAEQYATHKYDYLGETATTFAISLILAKQYPKLGKPALHALAKKFKGFARLHKVINQEIHLKDHVLSPYLSDTINNIIGVLFSYYGIHVVEKFITSAVLHTAKLELNEVGYKPSEKMTNPIWLLQQLVAKNGGALDGVATAMNGYWSFKLICKLNQHSVVFQHSRNAPSKQKARTEASQDILTYLNANPAIADQLAMPLVAGMEEPHTLPIDINDYYQLPNTAIIPTTTMSQWSPTDDNNNNNSAHISAEDNDETLQRLSDLLLGGSSSNDSTTPEGNEKKRPRQNLFTTTTTPMDHDMPYIKQEDQHKTVLEETNFNDRVVSFFKQIFDKNRSLLSMTKLNPGQSKSVLLSLVVPQQDILHVDMQTKQEGSSHAPMFHAIVVLKSKVKPNVFLKTEGWAQKKRDAEQQAFKQLIELITEK